MKTTPWIAILVSLACSQRPAPTPAADAGVDAGAPDSGWDAGSADAGPPDAGPTCGDPAATPDMDCGTLGWADSGVTSRLRNHHFSFVATTAAGTALYAVGGFNAQAALDNVDMAPIQGDGSLGAFSATTPLPLPLGGMTGALVANVVVVAGGEMQNAFSDQSYSAVVQADGTLGPWQQGGSVGHPRMHAAAFAFGHTIYVLGGFNEEQVWDDVVAATVASDGTLSPWVAAGTLAQPLSHSSLSVVGNYVYLAGGLNQSAYLNPPDLADVTRGTLGADGTLGEWKPMTPLPVPNATHASFVYGGYLYIAGGINNTPDMEDRTWRTPIQSDGTLGAWEQVASLPIARGHVHGLPLFGNHVYSVAGAIDFLLNSTGEVDIGTFE